ncbi:uncharacterized protein LTR77_005077 [Saxophila tyrrhenica]|uniref:F-box domain-containing protein n=1 Tax=Saxophila tyrrhenica TaxID=1690608 RepID=A0AAV9PAU5_9PEZI|nr:hypothetical protein LTR77_005077 [Saxophila tyrrhenica]
MHSDFVAIPWCKALLEDSSYEHVESHTGSLDRPLAPGSMTLMARTLATPATFRAITYLYSTSSPAASTIPDGSEVEGDGGHILALISVGSEMTSHVNTLHGGILSTLVDEVGGALAMREAAFGTNMMAVNFNINLKKPTRTPSVILGRAWREKKGEGRKHWIRYSSPSQGLLRGEQTQLTLILGVLSSKTESFVLMHAVCTSQYLERSFEFKCLESTWCQPFDSAIGKSMRSQGDVLKEVAVSVIHTKQQYPEEPPAPFEGRRTLFSFTFEPGAHKDHLHARVMAEPPNANEVDRLSPLPPEVLTNVFSRLTTRDICRARRLNKRIKSFVDVNTTAITS